MRILMITQLFQPEPNHLKGLAFAKELVRLGHEVEVLTGFPNYPGGKIYPGYRQRLWQRETLEGIPVLRVPLYPDHSGSGLRRMLCYLSLALTACLPGLLLARRPDVVHVYQGPATLALPAMLLRLLRGVPYVLDVQDLWPESVTSSGMLALPRLTFLLHKWCDLTLRLSRRVVVLSPGYRRVLGERGVPERKVEVVYNWCSETPDCPAPAGAAGEDRFGLGGRFTVLYAGNLGRVQALDAVLGAAALLRQSHPEVLFALVGDGVDTERLKALAGRQGLDNVRFIPRQPVAQIGTLLAWAEALLIHLRDDPLCRVGIPQKTQAYLAAGRPVLVAVQGEAAQLVLRARGGLACQPEQAESIAQAVRDLAALSPRQREEMGQNGRSYYERHLAFAVGVKRMDEIFKGSAA